MTKLAVERFDIEGTDAFFQSCEGFEHLRSRKRGPVLTVVSGPADDPIQHVRLRRVTKQWWEVEAPTSSGHGNESASAAFVSTFSTPSSPTSSGSSLPANKPGTNFRSVVLVPWQFDFASSS